MEGLPNSEDTDRFSARVTRTCSAARQGGVHKQLFTSIQTPHKRAVRLATTLASGVCSSASNQPQNAATP